MRYRHRARLRRRGRAPTRGWDRWASRSLPSQQQHFVYVIGDLIDAPFDLNVGIGGGLTGASTAWTFKTILGLAF